MFLPKRKKLSALASRKLQGFTAGRIVRFSETGFDSTTDKQEAHILSVYLTEKQHWPFLPRKTN